MRTQESPSHPGPDELVSFFERELPAEQDDAIHLHVVTCERCLTIIEEVAAAAGMLDSRNLVRVGDFAPAETYQEHDLLSHVIDLGFSDALQSARAAFQAEMKSSEPGLSGAATHRQAGPLTDLASPRGKFSGKMERRLWWQKPIDAFRAQNTILRVAYSAAAVGLVVGPFILLENHYHCCALEPKQQIAPQPTHAEGVSIGRKNESTQASESKRMATQPPQRRVPVLAFILQSAERSVGKDNTVLIPPGQYRIRFQLNLESDDYQRYSASIQTPEGKQVRELKRLRSQIAPGGNRAVVVTFRSDLLSRGDYIVRLSGETRRGTVEEIGGYAFRVPASHHSDIR